MCVANSCAVIFVHKLGAIDSKNLIFEIQDLHTQYAYGSSSNFQKRIFNNISGHFGDVLVVFWWYFGAILVHFLVFFSILGSI